jgi:hypothetical protein
MKCILESLVGLLLLSVLGGAAWAEVSYPPKLPGGKVVATETSGAFLKGPESMKGVAVAAAAPAVDFLFYPGQTYKGNPWSNWGDGVAVGEKYYSAIGDHLGPAGNAFVYEYDASSKKLRKLVDLRKVLKMPEGHYTPGKIHSRIDIGSDGWLYYSTHRGSTRVTVDKYHYKGDWILRTHPESGKTEIVAHGPVGKQCIPTSVLDPKRLIFYGSTSAGDRADKRQTFFAYDTRARKLLYRSYDGPSRYMIFAKSSGMLYYTPKLAGKLLRYDPEKGAAPVQIDAEIGLRAATQETPDGYVYTVSNRPEAAIYRFNTRSEKVDKLAGAAVGKMNYITTIDADPSGRYLYYVPGAHGGTHLDGGAVVQFDVKTRKKKVIAYLHPFLKEKYGYTPIGTFSTAVSAGGDKLYITWHGSLAKEIGRKLSWDACALTVIHIPASERASVAAGAGLKFTDATAAAGLDKPLKGMMSHAAACGDIDGDGDLDLYVGAFCDRAAKKYKGASGPVPNVLLINKDGRFVDSGQAAPAFKARTSGAVFADLDNDGDLDLYVSNNSKSRGLRVENKLFENVKGKFRDVSKGNGACVIFGGRSVGVLDFDGDGLLDLLVGGDQWTGSETKLFRNQGKLAFEDASAKAGLPKDLPGLGVLTCDFNGDGFPDIFISQANRMFLSKGDGTYAESKAASASLQYKPLGREDTPCGAAAGDVNGDGLMDIVIVDHNQPARQHLFINCTKNGSGVLFRQATKDAGLAYLFPSWTPGKLHLKHAHVDIADFDNDSRPDIAVAVIWRSSQGTQPFICRNLTPPGGKLRFSVPPIDKAVGYFPAGPIADFDSDGRPDFMLASWFPEIPSRLMLNRSKAGHWLKVRVIGKMINRMGIGSKIRIYQPGKLGKPEALIGHREIHISNGFCTGRPATAHFGLGPATICDVEITLPHKKGVIRKTGVKADQLLTVTEP